jgi:hypothetical protein
MGTMALEKLGGVGYGARIDQSGVSRAGWGGVWRERGEGAGESLSLSLGSLSLSLEG